MSGRAPIGVVAILACLVVAPVIAQQIVSSGNALDNNLRLGSRGYNRAAGAGNMHASPIVRQEYRAQSTVDRFMAFENEGRYRPSHPGSAPRAGQFGGGRGGSTGPDPAATERYSQAYDAGYQAAMQDLEDVQAQDSETAAHQMELISYGIGYFLGEAVLDTLARDGLDADLTALIRGFRDGLFENAPQIPRDELDDILAQIHAEVQGRLVEQLMLEAPERRQQAEANLARSRAFHQAYGQHEGVVTLDNGIQYRVLTAGDGRSPGPDDLIVANFRALRLDGSLIDQGQAVEAAISEMTPGGAAVLQMMQEGDRWEIAIPPDLAYGRGGLPPNIGPNETVFGVVELIEIR